MPESLKIWDTPFCRQRFPGVSIGIADGEGTQSVRVHGAETIHTVCFPSIASIKYTKEDLFPIDRFNKLPRNGDGCCYVWCESPWCREFAESASQIGFSLGSDDLKHYVILGGDWIVEALSVSEPVVTKND